MRHVDAHVHLIGGGGEAGPSTRVPPVSLTQLSTAGITTVVGVLGTDGTTRSVADLVARTLGLIGDPSSVDLLKPLLDHPDRKVALSGALALAKLKDKSGLAFARKSAKDSDANVRRAAAEILAQVGTAEDAPVLQKLASDPDASVKNVANLALERWKKPAAPARKTAPETPRKTKKQ
jgi:HEAT repeat protein